MKNQVIITGEAPAIGVCQNGKLLEKVRSRTRLAKRALQEGWRIVEVQGKPVATLASEIREENESWPSAMSRAHALQNL